MKPKEKLKKLSKLEREHVSWFVYKNPSKLDDKIGVNEAIKVE